MRSYALITLNMLEYVRIYLNKESSEYARTLHVSDAIHCKSERFLRKPKMILLYDPQTHHLKAFRDHLQ